MERASRPSVRGVERSILRIDFFHNLHRYLEFRIKEWIDLFLMSLMMAFIFSFDNWGTDVFSFTEGFSSLIKYFIISFLLMLAHVMAQKIVGVFNSLKVTYEKYSIAMLFSVFIAFLTFGKIPIFIPGILRYEAIFNLRVGKFRAIMSKEWETCLTAGSGAVANLLLTIPLNLLYLWTGLPFFKTMVIVSLIIAAYSLIPLPVISTANPYEGYMNRFNIFTASTAGLDVYFGNRSWYFFLVGATIAFAFLTLAFNYFSILMSAIVGLVVLIGYYAFLNTLK